LAYLISPTRVKTKRLKRHGRKLSKNKNKDTQRKTTAVKGAWNTRRCAKRGEGKQKKKNGAKRKHQSIQCDAEQHTTRKEEGLEARAPHRRPRGKQQQKKSTELSRVLCHTHTPTDKEKKTQRECYVSKHSGTEKRTKAAKKKNRHRTTLHEQQE
jgi:hypothetical protein